MSEITKAYEKLQEYVAQNELERRKWAGEIWTHTTGRIYKTARISLPLLSVISVFLCVIYAFIRDAQTFLKNTGGLSYEAQDSTAHFYIVAVFGVIVVVANALIYTKIRRIGEIVNTAISLLMGIYRKLLNGCLEIVPIWIISLSPNLLQKSPHTLLEIVLN